LKLAYERRSREGGNPFLTQEQALRWIPDSAGTTLRQKSQPSTPRGKFAPACRSL
jgi:hypothetical protein